MLVEQHELQYLPQTAVLVVDASGGGGRREVKLVDANPAIAGLEGVSQRSLQEAGVGVS